MKLARTIKGGRTVSAAGLMALAMLLVACSGDDSGSMSELEAETRSETQSAAPARAGSGRNEAPAASAQPSFSDEEIAAMKGSPGDEWLVELSQNNLACEVLTREDVAAAFGGEWGQGRFNWFESELRRATTALAGICMFGSMEPHGTVTLRLYESSDLAWELNRRDDEDFTRRFTQRQKEPAPEIAERAYRKPMGADTFDLTCADLGRHIACLSAGFRHTEDWTRKDREIMAVIRANLESLEN